ncbi:MAG: hypothetical protein EP346_08390 [Bacteroidetes bacterium]|nr:MAG: hypothetical protein EP346_08390 [Bacteroidota bacterium]
MIKSHINLKQNLLILQAKRAPLFILSVLSTVLFAFAVIPFSVLFFAITSGKGLHIGVFLSFGLCGLLGFYLLRLILWNAFGKEVYTFEKETVIYYADYKWFKDNRKEFYAENLIYKVVHTEEKLGFLQLNDGKTQHTSSLPVTIDELYKVIKDVESSSLP